MGKSISLAFVTFTFVGCLGIWVGGCQTPEQKVEKLISKLQNKNPKNRQSAEAELTKMGTVAVPALIQALQDPKIRQRVVGVLAKIGEDASDAVPAMLKKIQYTEIKLNE